MKCIVCIVCVVCILNGQNSVIPQVIPRKLVIAVTQQAQTINLNINAELATSLETARLNIKGPDGKLLYPDIQSLVKALLNLQLKQLVNQYPTESIKIKKGILSKAQIDVDSVENAIMVK